MNLQSINCLRVRCHAVSLRTHFPLLTEEETAPVLRSASWEGKNMPMKVPSKPPTFQNCIAQLTWKQLISHGSSLTESKQSPRLQVKLLVCPCPGLAQVPYLFLQEHACHWSESMLWHWGSSLAASRHCTEELWYWWTRAGKWRRPW